VRYATGPCRKCGGDEWGPRETRYVTTDGEVKSYPSRYCILCSRDRARATRLRRVEMARAAKGQR